MIIFGHTVPTLLIWLGALAAVAAAGFSFWRFLKPDLATLVMAVLRGLFLAVLAWCLFMPERKLSLTRTLKPRFIVALDASQSMQLTPPGEASNRWSAAQDVLHLDWPKTLAGSCEIDVYPVGTEVGAVTDIGRAGALAPDQPATLLREGLM